VGKYSRVEDNFHLNGDSTFIYEYYAFHAFENSKGTWKREGKRHIVLNSDIKSRIIPLKVIALNSPTIGETNLSIHVNGDLDKANYKCAVFINDTLCELKFGHFLKSTNMDKEALEHEINVNDLWFRYIRCDSLLSVTTKTPIRNIYFIIRKIPIELTSTNFAPTPLETEKYFFNFNKSDNSYNIIINFNDSLFSYKVFNNEKVELTKRGIKIYSQRTKKWRFYSKMGNVSH
jgi:hypothetical protein